MIIIRDIYFRIALIISILAIVGAFSIAYVEFADVSHLLIIHFDSYRGIDFLGDKWDAFGIIGLGGGIAAINFLLATVLYDRERFLAYFLSFFSVLISLLILAAILSIIAIN